MTALIGISFCEAASVWPMVSLNVNEPCTSCMMATSPGPNLQRAELGNAADDLTGSVCRHAHHILETDRRRDAARSQLRGDVGPVVEVQEVRHDLGQVHAPAGGRRERMTVGGERIEPQARDLADHGRQIVEAAPDDRLTRRRAAPTAVEDDALLLGSESRRDALEVLGEPRRLGGLVGVADEGVRDDVAGAQKIDDIAHQRRGAQAADVTHHLERDPPATLKLLRAPTGPVVSIFLQY